jgi:hypothetical protein
VLRWEAGALRSDGRPAQPPPRRAARTGGTEAGRGAASGVGGSWDLGGGGGRWEVREIENLGLGFVLFICIIDGLLAGLGPYRAG